jgi:phosphoribosylformylglycinamidine synthase
MAFASRCGVTLDLDGICFDAQALDVDGAEKRPNLMAGRDFENIVRALFNEELGALIQVRRKIVQSLPPCCAKPACLTISSACSTSGTKSASSATPRNCCAKSASTCSAPGPKPATRCRPARQPELRPAGVRPHPRYQRSRPVAADRLRSAGRLHQGLSQLGAKPRMAILREQGVNSHYEMAAAFDRAGFQSVDVHMSDILAGRVNLKDFKGLVACGGFSTATCSVPARAGPRPS